MRTVTLKSVLEGACEVAGLEWQDLGEDMRESVLRKVQRRTKQSWAWDTWPELCPVEYRIYRDQYDSGTAYLAPTLSLATEVFYLPAQKYYPALRDTTGNAPATLSGTEYVVNAAYWAECSDEPTGDDWLTGTVYAVGDTARNPDDNRYYACHTAHTAGGSFDATKFGVLTPFAAYIGLDQTGRTPIGEVIALYANDPDVNPTRPGLIRHRLSARGIVPLGCFPVAVYVHFRLRVPAFTSEEWDGAGAYVIGDRVYSQKYGDCYLAIGDVAASSSNQEPELVVAKWTKQEFPQVLERFVSRAAGADILRADGQNDKANAEQGSAFAELGEERDIQVDGQTPAPRIQVRTYGS